MASAQTSKTSDCPPAIRRKLKIIPGRHGPGTAYRAEFAQVALGAAILGATLEALARLFGVDEDTITNWRRAHPAFDKAIKTGTHYADAHVVNAFYRRATGYEVTTTRTEVRKIRDNAGNLTGTMTITTTTEQHVPADPVAGWRWLQLRQKWYVRDRLTVSDIVEIARSARAEMARRGIDYATALEAVQAPGVPRCPTCGAIRSAA